MATKQAEGWLNHYRTITKWDWAMCDQCFWNESDRIGLFLHPHLKEQVLKCNWQCKTSNVFFFSLQTVDISDGWLKPIQEYIHIYLIPYKESKWFCIFLIVKKIQEKFNNKLILLTSNAYVAKEQHRKVTKYVYLSTVLKHICEWFLLYFWSYIFCNCSFRGKDFYI